MQQFQVHWRELELLQALIWLRAVAVREEETQCSCSAMFQRLDLYQSWPSNWNSVVPAHATFNLVSIRHRNATQLSISAHFVTNQKLIMMRYSQP